MAQIIREIRVDVSQPNVFQAIVAKQLDCNSRFLKITLVDFGVKIEVPKTAKVTINANRPDGKSQSFMGVANNDGTITVPLAQWMLEVAGELKCDVSVINTTDNKRLTSTDFYVNVQEAANKSTDISENPDGEIRVITPVNLIDENSGDDEYPSAKAVYDLDNITATASGNTITIDSASAPLQNLKLFGKTEQNGTPTPDAPVPLVSVGDSGSFEVGVCGRNLLENKATIQTANGVTFTVNEDKSVTTKGTSTTWTHLKLNQFILPKGNYIITLDGGISKALYPTVRDTSNNLIVDGYIMAQNGFAFALSENKEVWVTVSVAQNVTVDTTVYPMIRSADITDNTYEPFTKQTLTMPYTLRSVGDIKDEVDFNRGVLIQRCESAKGFTLAENFTNTKRFRASFTNRCVNAKGKSACTHTNNYAYVFNNADYVHYYIENSNVTIWLPIDFDEAKTDEIEVVGVLETPIETPLTETELNAYRHLMTNKPNTTILSEAKAEVDYYINKPNAQAIGNIHSQVNNDYFKLQQAIISLGGSTL